MTLPRDRRGRILPPPTFDADRAGRSLQAALVEKRAAATLRAAITRFQTACGMDAAIALLKTELVERGEDRARLDAAAAKADPNGQLSILNAGR